MFGLIPHRRPERKLAREYEPLGLIRPELATLFDRFFGRWSPFFEVPWEEVDLGLQVEEKDKEVLVTVAVPGFEPGQLVVEVNETLLTIHAEHKEKEEARKEPAERLTGRMLRSIVLPTDIEVEKVEAFCKNGVLQVRLPKKPEATLRRIEVKT